MKTARLDADDDGIAVAAELLRRGELVAFPTETVYGLGGLASNDDAVRSIFAAKGRPADRPVIVHLGDASQIDEWSSAVPDEARSLAHAFWPGPLTLIVPRAASVSDVITGGRDTVGLRVPAHPVARALLSAVGDGVAAPSANRYGHVSPTLAEHVLADLDGRIAAVVDGGPSDVGLESTIVEVVPGGGSTTSVTVLRHGGVPETAVRDVLGRSIEDGTGGTGAAARAPGMVQSHYAPEAPVRIVDVATARSSPEGVVVIAPDMGEDDVVFAAALYARLRDADRRSPTAIWVVPPASGALLPAILDRLGRAAHR